MCSQSPDLLHALRSLQRVHGVLEGGEQAPLDVESPGVFLRVRAQLGHHAVLEGEAQRGGLQQSSQLIAARAGTQASRRGRLVDPHVLQLLRKEGLLSKLLTSCWETDVSVRLDKPINQHQVRSNSRFDLHRPKVLYWCFRKHHGCVLCSHFVHCLRRHVCTRALIGKVHVSQRVARGLLTSYLHVRQVHDLALSCSMQGDVLHLGKHVSRTG